jgi:hypothetical protein
MAKAKKTTKLHKAKQLEAQKPLRKGGTPNTYMILKYNG